MMARGFSAEAEELVRRVQMGERGAFDRLVHLCAPRLTRFVRPFADNRDDFDDLLQEIFIQLFQAIPQFRGASAATTFIFAVAHRTCLSRRRAWQRLWKRHSPLDDLPEAPQSLDPDPPAEAAVRAAREACLREGLAQLPEDQRSALLLAHVYGFSYEQIAVIAGVPVGTVRSRLNRAREKMQAHILAQRELFGRQRLLTK